MYREKNKIICSILLFFFFICSFLTAQDKGFRVPKPGKPGELFNGLELYIKVLEHLSGFEDHSDASAISFGFSKQDVEASGFGIGIGPVGANFSRVNGEFTSRGKVTVIKDLDVGEINVGLESLSGGISIPVDYLEGRQGEFPDFFSFRLSGTVNLGDAFKGVVKKVPVIGNKIKQSPALQKITDFLTMLSNDVGLNAGATYRIDFNAPTATDPLSIRLATSIDKNVGASNIIPSRKLNNNASVTQSQGRQFQFTVWHIEAIFDIQFDNKTRKLLDPGYGVNHPFYDPSKGPLSAVGVEDNVVVKGFGKNGQPISITSDKEYAVSFTPLRNVQGGKRSLALTTQDNAGFGGTFFKTGLQGGLGIAPYDIASGELSFGGDLVLDDIARTNAEESGVNFVANPITRTAQIPLLDSFDGVDFTGLNVIGLDVDQSTRAVNFILRGNRRNSASGPNQLNNESALLKKVFIEALSIPNDAQFVSLETNPPKAIAYEPFKHTEMGQIFFIADEQMKKDFAREVYVNPGGKNLVQEWYDRLAAIDTPSNFLKKILDRGVIPAISFNIRANITPRIPQGNKTANSKVFINDAKYTIVISEAVATLRLIAADGGNITVSNSLPNGTAGITTQELNIFTAQLNAFNTVVVNRTNSKRTKIINRVNDGVGVYRDLKRILPAIVAAQWYKQSGLAAGSLKDIIDTGNLSSKYTGFNLSIPFNQSLWDSKADQLLATLSVSTLGYAGTSTITGGVTINRNVAPEKLVNNFTSTQQVIFDESLKDGFNSENYVNAGGPKYSISEIIPTGIYMLPNTKNLVAYTSEFIENRPIKVSVGVANNGNKRANNVLVNVYAQKEGGTAKRIKSATISIDPYETRIIKLNYNPGRITANRLSESFRIFCRVNEDEKTPELSYNNNQLSRVFEVGYILATDEGTEASLSLNLLKSSSRHLFATRYQQRLVPGTLKNGVKISVHAMKKIVMEPGFSAKEGSRLRAWIGTDTQALAAYNNLTPVGSSSAKETKETISQGKVLVQKEPPMPIDARLEKVKEINLREGPFSIPVIENYEIINAFEIEENLKKSSLEMKVFPNPTKDVVTLELDLKRDTNLNVDLYTISGVKVKRLKDYSPALHGINVLTLDLSGFSNGMYLLVIKNGKEEKISSKLVLKN